MSCHEVKVSDNVLTVESIKNILSPLFMQNNVRSAVLFGSYAKNTATESSDIDLLVDCDLTGLKFIGFAMDIEDALNKKADVFDITHIVNNSKVDNEIKNTGIKIYG